MNIFDINKHFKTEKDALIYLEKLRWKGHITCPFCGSDDVWIDKKELRYRCYTEGRSFSVMARTIFEETRLDLRKWFQAIALMLNAKKGISAMQVSRDLGVSYKTAWYCLMRIRCAFAGQEELLHGIIETDVAFLGGKPRKGNLFEIRHHKKGKRSSKARIVAGVERGKKGKVFVKMIPDTTAETLMKVMKENIGKETSIVITDNAKAFQSMDKEFNRLFVTHGKEFSKAGVSINKVEGFFSLMKRGLIGQYHKLSVKYLPFYLAEFTYRYNHSLDKKSWNKAIELAIVKRKCMLRYKCDPHKKVEICKI